MIAGKYFLSAIVLQVLATAGTVSVLYIHFHRGLHIQMSPVIKRIILEWVATGVCLRGKVRKTLGNSTVNEVQVTAPAKNKKDRTVKCDCVMEGLTC